MPTKNCAGCLQAIKSRQFLCCCSCGESYDLLCANVSEQRFRNTLTGEHRQKWKCDECRSREPKSNNSDTPARAHDDDKVTRRRGASAVSPVEGSSPVEAPESSSHKTLEVLSGKLEMLVEEIRTFRNEMSETRQRVLTFDEKLFGLVTQVETCVSEVKELRTRVEQLENRSGCDAISDYAHSSPLVNTIESLKAELNERDQELLLNDIEVTCVPEQRVESLQHIVMTLASKVGVQLGQQDCAEAQTF
ncbi:unnamed protein product [Diatraea saccharalis]|uniref:PHD-type domain-containing protein n=1 Tax=Diatraea saccharalis TaxID=40085 RepID=A0A9N9QPR5_9NEOP|nr:unnamed protein product [Diatraea saccharalis]